MSKKSSVKKAKKTGRRLKRSVRRTLAAVLMITAIGVAAIPVPENLAEEPDPGITGGVTGGDTENIGDVHDTENFGYDAEKNGADIEVATGTNFQLNLYRNATIDDMLANLKTNDSTDQGNATAGTKPAVYASYTIRDISGEQSLIWEFLYYVGTEGRTKRGIVCKYNENFATDTVTLASRPITSYFTVSADEFKAIYDASYDNHETGDNAVTHASVVNKFNIDPTKTITFTYDDYLDTTFGTTRPTGMSEKEWEFLTKSDYCKADFDAACARFDAYYKWDSLPDDSTNKTEQPPANASNSTFEIIPVRDYINTDELQRQFYCENIKSFPGKGFSLIPVYDGRPGQNGGDIYVAQGTKDSIPDAGYDVDDNFYLAESKSQYQMGAIGERAFAGVTNVKNMKVPDMMHYIGDEAFDGAGLIESIDLGNATQIGNRAFKNCDHLSKVTLAEGTEEIGKECFYGTAITTIELPSSVRTISYGAFASCTQMTSVDFNKLSRCTIDDYAFYGCTSLKEVDMTDAGILSIGKGAFAADSGVLEKFTFPQVVRNGFMDAPNSIGDYMFAGRSSLKTVVFPKNYGRSSAKAATLPENMFHGCTYLEYVEFPANYASDPNACSFVSYTSEILFRDVRGTKLYVRGPKEHTGTPDIYGDVSAYPRRSTWVAKTAENGYSVPYLYVDSTGREYYEVCRGDYLLCIRKNEDGQTGILTSCTLKPGSSQSGDVPLVIPAMVGDTKVTSIASDCFTDEKLNNNVETLIIEDDSISTISDGVFKGWPRLAKVSIGNSVTSIGNEAFADCNNLVDVTFNSPMNGDHQGFKIGTDAFKTGSTRLTFHGDIVKGYAPFEWATDPDNIIKQPEGIRVCYKSLTPTYLTVMYNPNTELVTLLDYPKYNQVSKVLNEAHENEFYDSNGNKIYKSYEDMMEQRSYADYSDSYYDGDRIAFANAWASATNKEDVYNSDNYGPWVNADFCYDKNSENYWEKLVSNSGSGGNSGTTSSSSSTTTQPGDGGDPDTDTDPDTDQGNALNTLTDWLFEPIVAYAAEGDPMPYYSHPGNGYDVVKYSEMSARKPWQTTTSEADALINATKEIVVPAGVDSIDVYGYYNNLDRNGNEMDVKVADNLENAKQYLTGVYGSWDADTVKMYTIESLKDEDNINSVPGLFSGTYDDKAGEDKEKRQRGNDRIISVTLNSVKYLPDYAFDSCEQLTTVILGPDCADIGTAPFRGCYSLKAVSDNDYYKTNNGIVYSVNPDGSYAIEECLWARGLAGGVGEAQVSLSTDENLGRVSIIKDGAFEDCDNITLVDLTNTAGLVEIPKRAFKNCDNLNRIWLPASVNSIDDEAFVGANQLSELQIPGKEVFISGHAFDENKLATTSVYTSEDSSARRYVDTYGKRYKLEWH
ncbi:MAG: leucine-rich repeat protein, partial [Lachnospiraceae bacterium]|nr:leucine-rich repeat protein [Lachnospiraceae bacterium]